MKRYPRSQRIDTLLQQFVAETLRADFFEEVGAYVSITRVQCTQDLRHAHLWYLTHGTDDHKKVQSKLDSIAWKLRSLAGKRLHLKRTPEMTFFYDAALDQGSALSIKLGHDETHQ